MMARQKREFATGMRIESRYDANSPWLPGKIVEASCLRGIYWVTIEYPDGLVLERPRGVRVSPPRLRHVEESKR